MKLLIMKVVIPLLVLFILLVLVGRSRENYKTFNTPLNLEVGHINNKHIVSKNRITIKNNKIIIGKKEITKDDIIAFNALPLHYNKNLCLPDDDGECIKDTDFKNLKNYWNDGTIIAYSGELSKIPPKWIICDGANGTPDLRERFIIGAGKNYKQKSTGGTKTHSLTMNELPIHKHDMAFPASSKDLDTSKPQKVGDIRYGRHGDHLGKHGDGFASMCKKDGSGNELTAGKDFIPGNNIEECVSNIYATQKDSYGKTKYRNKLSKQPRNSYDTVSRPSSSDGTTQAPTQAPKQGFIDTDIYEPVPLYEILYKETDKIKSVGFRQTNGANGDSCTNTCMYFRDTGYWESERNIKDKTKVWMKTILINDGKDTLLNKETNIFPEIVKQNVKDEDGYYVGPTSNACKNCNNSDSHTNNNPINYAVFQTQTNSGVQKLSTENIAIALENKTCYTKYKELHALFNTTPTITQPKCHRQDETDKQLLAFGKNAKEICERTDRNNGFKYTYTKDKKNCGCHCCKVGVEKNPQKELYKTQLGNEPSPNKMFDYLKKFEGNPCLNNDNAKGNPHDNMPSFYRVIFLMRNVNHKPKQTQQTVTTETKPKSKEQNRCDELISKLKKAGVPPVYLNCN